MTTNPDERELVRIGSIVERTRAEGPGLRFAVWAQGCSIRCPGCFNPHFWSSQGGTKVAPETLAGQAVSAGVEGVTLLGGEPFEQAGGFAMFAKTVRAAGLSVMVFTGYELEYLKGRDAPAHAAALLDSIDLLVDGTYQADKPDLVRPWVGSTNQRFHFLTDRYRLLEDTLATTPDRIELRVGTSGHVAVNGWAPVDLLDALLVDVTPQIGRGQVR